MKLPEWVQPGIVGAIVGAIVLAIVGFTWGGWVTQSTADRLAAERVDAALVSALTPVCVDRALEDPEAFDELADITSSFQRRNFVEETGWATPPDQDQAHRGIAVACAAALEDVELEAAEQEEDPEQDEEQEEG